MEGLQWGSQTIVMTGLLRDQSVDCTVGMGWSGLGIGRKQERLD